MDKSADLIQLVTQTISAFLLEQKTFLAGVASDLEPFTHFAVDLLASGKKIRSQLCYWGWQCGSEEMPDAVNTGSDDEFSALIRLCAGLEIFHTAALVHDDIIDRSDTRRGLASIHKRFEAMHRTHQWSGESARYGEASGILFGDLLLGWSDALIAESVAQTHDARAAQNTRMEFDRMRTEVTLGQYLDVLEEKTWLHTEENEHLSRAERVITYKSAKYSVEAPLVLGASLRGAAPEQLEHLRKFGLPLGIAFQLRDDLLGVFGDPKHTGKPSGDDLREGKRTVLIALTRKALPTNQKKIFDDILVKPEIAAEEIATMQSLISESGAVAQVEELIAQHRTTALSYLAAAPFSADAKKNLHHLAHRLSERSK